MSANARHWGAFVAVYRRGSMTLAAGDLYLTQPAVSLLIRELEANVGVPLFHRAHRTLQPTPLADSIVEPAEQMLGEIARFNRLVKGALAEVDATLTIAVVPSIGTLIMPRVLARFEQRYPNVRVSLYEGWPEDAERLVMDRRVEFAVGTFRGSPEVRLEAIAEYSLNVVCRRDSPLADAVSVTWADINRQPVITLIPAGLMHSWIEATFVDAGENFTPAFQVSKFTSAIALVREGLGCAIVPSYLGREYTGNGLIVRAVDEKPNVKPLTTMRAKGATLAAPGRYMVELIRNEVRSRL